jgi:hypothetical protein
MALTLSYLAAPSCPFAVHHDQVDCDQPVNRGRGIVSTGIARSIAYSFSPIARCLLPIRGSGIPLHSNGVHPNLVAAPPVRDLT